MRKRFSALSRLKKIAVIFLGVMFACCGTTLLLPSPDTLPTVEDQISPTNSAETEPTITEVTLAPEIATKPPATQNPTKLPPSPTVAKATLAPTNTLVPEQPTSVPTAVPATSTPAATAMPEFDAVGQCSSDLYNCADFSPVSNAQNMFDACKAAGYDDAHLLDWDKDGMACEQPDLSAERNFYNPPTPTAAPQVVIWCECSGDTYNCSSFPLNNGTTARQCFDYCQAQGAGDIHNLDGDADGNFCE